MNGESATEYNRGADGSFLGGGGQEGFEGARAQDFKNSYLIHLQTGSPQVKKEKMEYVTGAEAGMWFDTVTKKLYGKEITVCVLKRETVWLEFNSDSALVGVHGPDTIPVNKDDFRKWISVRTGNEITESINHYVILKGAEAEGVKILPLKGSDIKYAKSWFTDMKNTKTPDGENAHLFAGWWTLPLMFNEGTTPDGQKVDWYAIGKGKTAAVKLSGFISAEEWGKFISPGREFVKSLSQVGVTSTAVAVQETGASEY